MPQSKALLVGINDYKNFPRNSLRGCEQDVATIRDLLVKKFEFSDGDITSLVGSKATRSTIWAKLTQLFDGLEAGDRVLFHYSGHGTFTTLDGLEPDGNAADGLVDDGTLCPYDFDFQNDKTFLTSDDLRKWTQTLPNGVELVVILDSCHSEGGTRVLLMNQKEIRYDPKATGQRVRAYCNFQRNMSSADAKRHVVSVEKLLQSGERADSPPMSAQEQAEFEKQIKSARFLRPPVSLQAPRDILRSKPPVAALNHVLLAACNIHETAGDAFINNQFHGVFTYYLSTILQNSDDDTLARKDLITQVRNLIAENHFNQVPLLEAKSLDVPLFSTDEPKGESGQANGGKFSSRSSCQDPARLPEPSPSVPLQRPTATVVDSEANRARRRRLLEQLQGRRLEDAYLRPDLREMIREEAMSDDPDALLDRGSLAVLESITSAKSQLNLPPSRALGGGDSSTTRFLFNSGSVVIVPGFLASQLSDKAPNGHGLIWVNPINFFADRLKYLQLNEPIDSSGVDRDEDPSVQILSDGPLPVFYDLLRGALETNLFGPRYGTSVFAFDWRRNLDEAAEGLIEHLADVKQKSPQSPLYVIAHSQGALVARRALQLMNDRDSLNVDKLVMLGPANHGSLAAIRGFGNEPTEVDFIRKIAVEPPDGFSGILSSMSGLYQLLPSRPELVPWLQNNDVGNPAWWTQFPIDPTRLKKFFGWAEEIDTSFFDDRTAIILGDNKGQPTVGGVIRDGAGGMQVDPNFGIRGDGTVPHSCAMLPNVLTYLAPDTEHSRLPTYFNVISAVQALLKPNGTPTLQQIDSSDPSSYATPIQIGSRELVDTRSAVVGIRNAATSGTEAISRESIPVEQVVSSLADIAKAKNVQISVTLTIEPNK